MHFCPNCGSPVKEGAKFCSKCGNALPTLTSPTTQGPAMTPTQPTQPTQPAAPQATPSSLYAAATESLSHYTGETGNVSVNLSDLFSQVFKHHSKDEAEEIFIAGTKTTTPPLSAVSDEWAKPWLFSRILCGFLIAFIALLYMATQFDNDNAIPGLILVGAFAVPFSGLVFFFEANAFKNISLFQVIKIFFIGGIFSLLITLFLYEFVHFSFYSQMTGNLELRDAVSIGVVEELGKVLITSYFISQLNVSHILDGMLVGASVGAGFAAFETAGYIYRAGNDLVSVAIVRGWTAVGGHLVWAAIAGGALLVVKREKPFRFSQLLDSRFLIFFALAIALHAVWDWDLPILGSGYSKYILLIIVAWIIVFVLMNAGLKEIARLKHTAS
ncbi:PrsW family glutamic-type intramembrane protease [Secundilactobacillus similis]|nr:PrsW family intramembrane metalloprotease [Secundilactobacillus similis]